MARIERAVRGIAVDIGGTRFRVAVGNGAGAIEWRVSRDTLVGRGLQPVLRDMFATVEDAIGSVARPRTIRGIGIAAPGPLDPWTGVIHNPPNMPGWHDVPLKKLFEERFGIPTIVANDANLAAVGEQRYGAGRGFQHVVYVTVSTGIGGGVIADGRLLLGHHGYAGEVGHMTIDRQGPPCACGNVGCLEVIASGTAIARRARELVASGVKTSLADLPAKEITAKGVTDAAYAGDGVAHSLLHDAGVAMGVGAINLAHLFNPRRIILGGGVSLNAGPIWWDAVRETVEARCMPPSREELEIVPAALGDDAGLLGGIALVTERVRRRGEVQGTGRPARG